MRKTPIGARDQAGFTTSLGAWLIIALLALGALGAAAEDTRSGALPSPAGKLNDFARILKSEDAELIGAWADALEEKTGAQMAVVTVESFAPYPSIHDYALALGEAWGAGRRGEDDGVLFVLAIRDREVWIEVGYGLEGAIPDSAAGRILDMAVLPEFRRDNFSGGLVKGAGAMADTIARSKGLEPITGISGIGISGEKSKKALSWTVIILFLIFFVLILAAVSWRSRRSRGGLPSGPPPSFRSPSPRDSPPRRGPPSGGFKGGGGFGGGSFGGGGAGRKF
jgi:uncharacterized protein